MLQWWCQRIIKKKIMEFSEQKEMIVKSLRRGDKSKIAKRAGVSMVTLWSAFGKCCLSDMTDAEVKAYNASLTFVEQKQGRNEKLQSRTAEIVEKL